MKKIYIMFLIVFLSLLTGCNFILKYTGSKIIKLTYISIDYFGGYTNKHVLDFNENTYCSVGYWPPEEENSTLKLKSTFTDEKEKIFMDECYTYGLFNLRKSYSRSNIRDGSGWNLLIEYEDGTSKSSIGDNAVPGNVFSRCSTAFYDLCGDSIIASLPDYYLDPPGVSYAFWYANGGNASASSSVTRANFKWNKNESLDNNIYLINKENKANKFVEDTTYQLVLDTFNYDCDEKFNKIIVKEYDFNANLTNERVIYEGKWFKQIELELQLNKIYVYELSFRDDDYVQYTFNTYCKDII